MTQHTMIATFRVSFVPVGCVETESAEPTLEIKFNYLPGSPEQGPTYSHGGLPAEPAEVEVIRAALLHGDGLAPEQFQINDWADDYLASDEGYQAACAQAAEDSQRDREYAAELRADQ